MTARRSKLKSKALYFLIAILASGCASTYEHTELQPVSAALDRAKGVLISTPKDGWYGNRQYHNSGRMTVNAIRAAFAKYTSRVAVVNTCHGDDCLNSIDIEKYGYYVKPEILQWEDRATEWSGKRDIIEIQLAVYDAVTKKELANSSYTGKSKWASFGGDRPQDLLPEPTYKFVSALYK